MRFLGALVANAATALAASLIASVPFNLVTQSQELAYDGRVVTACHQGALTSSLCAAPAGIDTSAGPQFVFDELTTFGSGTLNLNISVRSGASTYVPMQLRNYPYTNIAMGYFDPPSSSEYGTDTFMFTSQGQLIMSAPLMDDRVAPNWIQTPRNETVNRWFICHTWAPNAYETTAVAWGLGATWPENPTCHQVNIFRVVT